MVKIHVQRMVLSTHVYIIIMNKVYSKLFYSN